MEGLKDRTTQLVLMFGILSTVFYVTGLFRGTVTPMLTTWIVLLTSSSLLVTVTRVDEGKFDLVKHSALAVGWGGHIIILFFTLLWDSGLDFTRFQLITLVGSCLGFGIFLLSRKRALLSSLAINGAVLVGFIPLWSHLYDGSITESPTAWFLITIASALGVIKPWQARKYAGVIFPVRAFITGSSVSAMTLWNMFVI
jgi:hypothetical protein